jgi:DNA-binding MarR family transcriptional regulator
MRSIEQTGADDMALNPAKGEPRKGRVRDDLRMNGTEEGQRWDIKLGFLIHDVSRLRRKVFDQLMKPHGVTRAQWWVLAHLSRRNGIVQTQLADVLDVGKASLGGIVERLEAGGWVERHGDPADKRAKRIYLAPNAYHLLNKMAAVESVFNEPVLKALSAADRRNLIRLLTTLKQALCEMDSRNGSSETSRPARKRNTPHG